jgi:hypothetical protein
MSRNTRYVLVAILLLIGIVYVLFPGSRPVAVKHHHWRLHDSDLPRRMEVSHGIYDNQLRDRQKLIKKFGPHAKDIVNFPPDKAPWPPYTVWDYFPAAFNCPHEVFRLGALGDGGKWVCGMSRLAEKPDCVIYSFGVDYESSFEAELLSDTRHCRVWGYDPTAKSFGSKIPRALAHRAHFSPYSLSDKHEKETKRPMYTLESLMRMNGHTHIDILKIDIEGSEFETIANLFRPYIDSGKPLPFGQLTMEIHLWDKSFESFLGWWEMLEEAGLRPFWTEPNLVYLIYNKKGTPDLAEYSFLNVKGDNIFIKDPPQTSNTELDGV